MHRLSLFAVLAVVVVVVVLGRLHSQADEPPVASAEDQLLERFSTELYQAFLDEETGCVDCHSSEGTSSLVLSGNALEDFRRLLDGRYLARTGPDTLLGRITSDNPDRRMPKDAARWSPAQVEQLTKFLTSIEQHQLGTGLRADEQFPRSLLNGYESAEPPQSDNQFLSYRQLRGKISAIFDDDWIRGDRDLFSENVAFFGGADFKTRFNESSEPSASFLTGLEMLSSDVAGLAYRRQRGPFAGWREPAASPSELDRPDDAHCQSITQLYQAILYRNPTSDEVEQAFDLLRGVHGLSEEIATRDSELVFELVVTDPETGWSQSKTITIPVSGDRLQLRQTIIDQRGGISPAIRLLDRAFRPLVSQIARHLVSEPQAAVLQRRTLGGPVRLTPGQSGQRLVIHNSGTHRNVSFAGVEIRDSAGKVTRKIDADAAALQVEGAWELASDDGAVSFEDRNRHKGHSTITVPLSVDHEGDYSVSVLWRGDQDNAANVLVELFAAGGESRLVASEHPSVPPQGEARFFYDCGNDTAPFVELDGRFQFDPEGYVEVSNRGTLRRVTAGAVEFLNSDDRSESFLVDSKAADGSDGWSRFDAGRFKAYNVKGEKLHDDNKNKGKLSLRYLPKSQLDSGWKPDASYQVRIFYPGKRDHETRVPVVVKAQRSSPIVQIAHPRFAKADSVLRLDASASYTVQRSRLHFSWRQISGPGVEIAEDSKPVLEFQAPRQSARRVAWSALCGALMRHPDFLFTRAPSLSKVGARDRMQLQLMKLALDLVGRPPNRDELELLASGMKLSDFADRYLDSQEFQDFYFHRIRLYLESQGTQLQDEPARLWSYVAFEDRPFQEILTADYTVSSDFRKVDRPDYHGNTGVLTTQGFIQGKPGLPHYNYAAQVSMLFLGYVYEVPPEIVEQREGVTALGTTDPNSNCYSCHKILTPLAFQRSNWSDDGVFSDRDEAGQPIDASDRGAVAEYPFAGSGMEAFAEQAVKKERFIRTIINTHFGFFFGRPMRHRQDERVLYKKLWDHVHQHDFKIRELLRAIVTSPEYLDSGDGLMDIVASGTEPSESDK